MHGHAAMTAAVDTAARQPNIAVACSGLGHVQRGVEAWAADLARALRRRGVPVTLFGAAATDASVVPLPCLKRGGRAAGAIGRFFRPLGGWRYGLGSAYEVEETTFSVSLWRRVRRQFDILHVQDPLIATLLNRLHGAGLSRPRVILANGTGESVEALAHLPVIQELTPAAAARWPARAGGPAIFTVPNFIDPAVFTPGDRAAARRRLGLAAACFVVLCCAAIKRYHKRIDYLIREFADFAASYDGEAVLVVAGAREPGTEAIIAEGRERLGARVRFLTDLPRAQMPDLYRAADLFVLTSLWETFGIVLLEAMATGLPVLCHDAPSFRYVAGPAGHYADLAQPGALARALTALAATERRAALARAARAHVVANFAEAVVLDQILAMYRSVAGIGA